MTSTPVKDVGSLLNFVGSKGSAASEKMSGTGGFGDVMNKASYGDTNSLSRDKMSGQKVNTEAGRDTGKNSVDRAHPRKDALKAENAGQKAGAEKQVTPKDQEQAAVDAGSEMVAETAKELGVSEEEVLAAMEELGLSLMSILDPDNLTKLVLTLSGEENSLALLTDEGLYANVQNLMESLDEVRQTLADEFGVSGEELKEMLADGSAEAVTAVEKPSELPVQEENPGRISVTVEESTQSVTLKTDENGNVVQVEGVTAKEEPAKENSSQNKGNAHSDQKEQSFEGNNPLFDALQKNQIRNADAVTEQLTSSNLPDSREIMDQILDYMKIQLKPEMDQLEMQLHPASLGTLKIHLVSKGGEVTAQFQVQNEAVKAAIESQLTVLKDSLKEQGVKVEAVEVTVESHAFESNLWQGQGREEGNAYQGQRKTPRRINLNALDEDFEEEASEEELLSAEMMKANGGTVDYTA